MNKTKFLKPLFSIGAALLVFALAAAPASASQINGTLSIIFGSPTLIGGTNLLTNTGVQNNSNIRVVDCSGDFCVVPDGALLGVPTLDLSTVGAGGGVALANLFLGNFTPTSGNIVLPRKTDFLNVTINGIVSGLSGACGTPCDPTNATLNLTFTITNGRLAGVGVLGTAAAVPEPGTMALLGGSLLGLAAFGRRRLAAKR